MRIISRSEKAHERFNPISQTRRHRNEKTAARMVPWNVDGCWPRLRAGVSGRRRAGDVFGVRRGDRLHGEFKLFLYWCRDGLTSITGGTFQLDGAVRDVSGQFRPGGVIDRLPGSNCRIERFHVTGELVLGGARTGIGLFDVLLTHYGKRIGGQCVTFFATVEGAVTFDFDS